MVSHKLEFRVEKDSDRAAIFEVNRLAFGRDAESRVVDLLRASDSYVPGLSIVATKDGEVVGHILFSRAVIQTPAGDVSALTLAPLAVRPGLRRQGMNRSSSLAIRTTTAGSAKQDRCNKSYILTECNLNV